MKKLIQKYQVGGDIPKYQNGSLFEKVMSNVSNTIRQARDSEFIEGADREIGQNITGNNVGRFVLNRIANNLDPNSTLFGWKMPSGIRTILGSPVTVTLASVPIINPASIGLGTLQYTSDKLYRRPSENQVKKQNTKSSNRLGPNGGLSVKKQGGIIKAAAGWRVQNKQLQVQLSPGGSWYYVDLTSDENGALYYKVNGSRTWARVTTHDRGYWKTHPELMKITTGENQPTIYDQYFNNANLFTSPSHQNKSADGTKPYTSVQSGQSNISTSFTPEQFLQTLLGNDEYIKRFKQLLGIQENQVKPDETQTNIKPESEATKTEVTTPTAPTYDSLVKANTASIYDGINNGYFRRELRKGLTTSMLNGTTYGYNNPTGTQVFDTKAIVGYEDGNPIYADAAYIWNTYGKDGKISRGDMRNLRKKIMQYKGNTIQNNVANFLNFEKPSPNASPAQTNLATVNGGQQPVEVINGQITTNANSFGLDKANGYPNTQNGFNGTSDIDPNAAHRAEQEKRNTINLQNRS